MLRVRYSQPAVSVSPGHCLPASCPPVISGRKPTALHLVPYLKCVSLFVALILALLSVAQADVSQAAVSTQTSLIRGVLRVYYIWGLVFTASLERSPHISVPRTNRACGPAEHEVQFCLLPKFSVLGR